MSTLNNFKGKDEGHAYLFCKYAYIWNSSMLHFITSPFIRCLFFILVFKYNSTRLKNDSQIVNVTNHMFNIKIWYHSLKLIFRLLSFRSACPAHKSRLYVQLTHPACMETHPLARVPVRHSRLVRLIVRQLVFRPFIFTSTNLLIVPSIHRSPDCP